MPRLTPRQTAVQLVTTYPDLLLLDPTAQNELLNGFINTQSFTKLVTWIAQNPPPAANEPVLPAQLLAQLVPVLAAALAATAQNNQLQGLSWNVQSGTVPGPQPVAPVGGSWTLTTLSPQFGLAIPNISASGSGAAGSFTLKLQNMVARHLGVYARCLAQGTVVAPAGWTSRLPAGVPATLESATLKFVGTLAPSVAVAALVLPATAQSLTIPLPSNANSVEVLFGGFGGSEGAPWQRLLIAAGTLLTFIFDYSIPAIIRAAGTDLSQDPSLSLWFQTLIAQPAMIASVLGASAPLVTDTAITDLDSLLASIAANLPAVLLGKGLSPLVAAIDSKLGAGTVAQAAPTLGWSAQMFAAFMSWQTSPGGTVCAQSPALVNPATFALPLSPATTVDVQLSVNPDPAHGNWPANAASYTVVIEYDGGFTQTVTDALPQDLTGDPLNVAFGGVPNGGLISIATTLNSRTGQVCASGHVAVNPGTAPPNRTVAATIEVHDTPVTITTRTTFRHYCTLDYEEGAYLWNTAQPQPAAVQFSPPAPSQSGVIGVVDITLQEEARCLGYTWQVAGLGLAACGGGPTLNSPFLFQNIGTLNPNAELITLACGFGSSPALVYQKLIGTRADSAFFFDPRQSAYCLRPVLLQPGTFDVSGSMSAGCFREGLPAGLALHPGGYAVAVFFESSVLEIVKVAPTPVPDASAPLSLAYAGPGTRAGLLQTPVGVAITPGGVILVLQAVVQAVAAFDVNGSPVPLFSNSSTLTLNLSNSATCLDIAVSPNGFIYILSSASGGATPADFCLDCYAADGAFLTRTTGVNAARIAVDSREWVYTLNYGTITGYQNRPEPSISVWVPSST